MNIYTQENGELIFNKDLFHYCLSEAFHTQDLQIISAKQISSPYETNIAKTKYAEQHKKLTGIFKYEIVYEIDNIKKNISVLVKSKISNKKFIEIATTVLLKAGVQLEKSVFANYLQQTSLGNGDTREIRLYQLALENAHLGKFFPDIYGTYLNNEKEEYIILEELLTKAYLIKDYQDLSFWNHDNIISAVQDLSNFHAIYYSSEKLAKLDWIGGITNTQKMLELTPLWQAYVESLKSYEGNLLTTEDINFYSHLIDTIPTWWKKIDSMQKTLIYNDLQIRNMAMRNRDDKPKLCLFDWEVATTHIPQRDLIEFLCYVTKSDVSDNELTTYLEESRLALEKATSQIVDKRNWLEGCLLALYDYQLERLSVQLIFHKIVNRPDIERVWHLSRRLLQFINKELREI